ncbi:MAG: SRPBCC domain-containing protein [Bacteroidota bacterium]
MENFNWTSFTKKIAVKAKLTDMYDAWTVASKIETWFLSQAVYFDTNNNVIDVNTNVKDGYTYAWNWYAQAHLEKGHIIKANGKDFIQFSFAGECIVEVTLTEENDVVIVALTQKNIPMDDFSKQNIRLGCATGWSFFLVNLKSVYEGGLDLRNKSMDYITMVNN